MYINLRTREGCDLPKKIFHKLNLDFNPRPREGSDEAEMLLFLLPLISIHAPVKGATLAITAGLATIKFQSTPP